jgi:hypothetical protein
VGQGKQQHRRPRRAKKAASASSAPAADAPPWWSVSIATAEVGREPETAGIGFFLLPPGKRFEGLWGWCCRVRVLYPAAVFDAAVVVAWVGESTVAEAR